MIEGTPTLKEIVERPEIEKYRKEVNMTWDGRQFIVRVPQKIARVLDLKKGDSFVFDLELSLADKKNDKLQFKIKRGK